MVTKLDLAIALEGNISKTAFTASPLRCDAHLFQINLLSIVIARKDVIKTQGAILKEVIKLLAHGIKGHKRDNGKKKMFHRNQDFSCKDNVFFVLLWKEIK